MAQPNPGGTQQIGQQRQTRFGNEVFRAGSRLVAYWEIIWSCVLFVDVVVNLTKLGVSGWTLVFHNGQLFKTEIIEGKFPLMLVMFGLLLTLFGLVKIWFATQLLSATKLTTPLPEAARKGRLYRNFKIIFPVFDGILLKVTVGQCYTTTCRVMWLLSKILPLFIGHGFVWELDQQIPPDDQ